MNRKLLPSIILSMTFVICSSGSAHADENEMGCGTPKPFSAYEFQVDKMSVRLSNFLEVIIDGRAIYSSSKKLKWNEAAMSAQYFKFKNYVFVEAREGDCIDLINRKLLSLDPRNSKSAKSHDILTGHHKDAFFLHQGALFYWSEWFCMKADNKEAKDNGAYLFRFEPAKSEFEKVFFNHGSGCYPADIEKSLKQSSISKTNPKILRKAGE